jgi:hypothetical protein
MGDADRNFVLQQGLEPSGADSCTLMTSALLFQPRVVGLWFLLGVVLRSGWVFLALAVVLWWNALVPALNPFEILYNRVFAGRSGRPALGPAPAPRRFSQGMGGTFAAAMAAALLTGSRGAAIGIGIVFGLAVAVLVFGRLCVGSFVYHLLRGEFAFAVRTLPWGRGA